MVEHILLDCERFLYKHIVLPTTVMQRATYIYVLTIAANA